MRRIVIESPYAGHVLRNEVYARTCCAHALALGDAPFASHLLYTQPGILDDTKEDERALGISAGFFWGAVAHATVVYIDLGVSDGMRKGIKEAQLRRRNVEMRTINAPITLYLGQEPIDEGVVRAASVFGGGDAAVYYRDQERIIAEMQEAAASGESRYFNSAIVSEMMKRGDEPVIDASWRFGQK